MTELSLFNNILLISGTGRNVGKTTFACQLIRKFSTLSVIGIKISPHHHEINHPENCIYQNNNFTILKECSKEGKKDSSKMLLSGAKEVYYIQADDNNLQKGFDFINDKYIKGQAVICESAALGSIIKPALHLKITNNITISSKVEAASIPFDYLVFNDGVNYNFPINSIQLEEGKWIINKKIL